jgi:hypothetical protein
MYLSKHHHYHPGMLEGNLEFSISWEYRYIFYDTFGRAMYKPLEVYRKLLSDAGFEIIKVFPFTFAYLRSGLYYVYICRE